MVVVAQLSKYTENHSIINFRWVKLMVCKIYFIKLLRVNTNEGIATIFTLKKKKNSRIVTVSIRKFLVAIVSKNLTLSLH